MIQQGRLKAFPFGRKHIVARWQIENLFNWFIIKVTLRKRKKNDNISLYLDYYHKGKRKTEYLRLYLTVNPKTKTEREVNKKTKQLAEPICAQSQIEIQNWIGRA